MPSGNNEEGTVWKGFTGDNVITGDGGRVLKNQLCVFFKVKKFRKKKKKKKKNSISNWDKLFATYLCYIKDV